jgi:hypothetical protein
MQMNIEGNGIIEPEHKGLWVRNGFEITTGVRVEMDRKKICRPSQLGQRYQLLVMANSPTWI